MRREDSLTSLEQDTNSRRAPSVTFITGECSRETRKPSGWEGREVFARDAYQNFTPAAGDLSVTAAARASDNGKTRKGRLPDRGCRPALAPQDFSYGVIFQTTP